VDGEAMVAQNYMVLSEEVKNWNDSLTAVAVVEELAEDVSYMAV